ncbi:23 kDa integral membrane protein-like isoform X1 [Schistocerca serialis cubense]|uniref:23 kDa integral membrane protein-like isoform X1 n=2 Tax=Schistocerca nitens TaxID=7011 RepID=UPI002118E6E1|nr:23 kDa integral membrane protein-like isoform X1 [Schistocerca nitens]XP_049964868.1 23 kDa integral membrane protein-like isoform X1 [Schistocerca serialis cubense]
MLTTKEFRQLFLEIVGLGTNQRKANMVSGGMSCVKYLLFTFNLLFVISGIVIVSVGALALSNFSSYDTFFGGSVIAGPVLLLIVGIIVFIVAFFGCCGALKENHCMVVTFSVLLLIIFAMELGGGIAGYVLKDVLKDDLDTQLNSTLYKYESNEDIKKAWDIMQTDLNCCGINGPDDWNKAGLKVPASCCPSYDLNEMCASKQYDKGCMDALEKLISHHAVVLGGVGIGIAFVQLVGVILACCLAKSIRKEYETV